MNSRSAETETRVLSTVLCYLRVNPHQRGNERMTRIVHIIGLLVLLAAGLLPAGVSAEDKPMIAILPLQASAKMNLDEEAVSYLSDVARGTAARVLGDGYIVQTEQNMQRILSGLGPRTR